MPKMKMATPAATNASSTLSGLTPAIHIMVVVVSPTTLPEPPALDAATIAGEIADVNFAAEDMLRDRAADQRRGDIVEKARKDGDDDEKRKAAFPVVRQERGHLVGNPALARNAATAARSP